MGNNFAQERDKNEMDILVSIEIQSNQCYNKQNASKVYR